MTFDKGDEMDCLVRGCNFLQTSVPREAFTFRDGTPTYLDKGQYGVENVFITGEDVVRSNEQHVLQPCLSPSHLCSQLALPGLMLCSERGCVPLPSRQHWVGRQHREGMLAN